MFGAYSLKPNYFPLASARPVMRRITLVASLLLFFTTTASLQAANAPVAEDFLTAGKLADGERELANYLKEHPTDDEARFGLGTIQFVRSIEHLTQSLYQFGALGANSRARLRVPLLRLPVPENPRPEKVRYADMRRMLQNLIDDLAKSEATLAQDQRPACEAAAALRADSARCEWRWPCYGRRVAVENERPDQSRRGTGR
jgi:hypothetical protein